MGYAYGHGHGYAWKSYKRFVAPAVPAAAPVNTVLPVISGTPTVGQTISTTTGTWTGSPTPTYTYQWKRAGASISGATASTYTLVALDTAALITVTVTATNASGSASATSASFGTINLTPSNAVAPVASGSLTVGSVLTSTTGTWAGTPVPTYAYQWKRDTTNVGTNASTYTLVTADIGAMMTCVVTGTNTAGSANATSNALGPVVDVGGAALLAGETDGFAVDFTWPVDGERVAVKTAGTVVSHGLSFFTNSGTSSKWVYDITGTLVSVAAGSLAVEYDPVTHVCKGLLVEPVATNMSPYSNTTWFAANGASMTDNTTTSPTGAVDADTLTLPSGGIAYAWNPIEPVIIGVTYTLSIFAKTASGTKQFTLGFWDNTNVYFSSDLTATTTWQRFSFSATMLASSTTGPTAIIQNNTADTSGSMFVWGKQVEEGSVATSFVLTPADASVTRDADTVSLLLSAIPTLGSAYSLYVRGSTNAPGMEASRYLYSLSDGTTSSMVGFRPLSTTLRFEVVNSATFQANPTQGTMAANTPISGAGRVKANDFAFSVGGAAATTDASGTLPTLTTIYFGSSGVTGQPALITANIHKMIIVPRGWSNAELAVESAIT